VKLKDKEHFGLGHNGVDLRPPEGKRSRTSGEAHPELHTSLDVIGRLRKLDMPGVVAYPVQ